MRRNCNLELGLFPPYGDDSGDDGRHNNNHHHEQHDEERQKGDHKHRQITIFYGGQICVSDVTELQAKSILMLANRKVEEKTSSMTAITSGPKASSSSPPPPGGRRVQSDNNNNNQLYGTGSTGTGTGLSMKKSLQRFLQKRKIRIQEASPYNH